MTEKHTHDHIQGLISDENEARKRQAKTQFKRLSSSVRIGINPQKRTLVFFEVKLKDGTAKFAIPVINMQFDDALPVWDELNEEIHE